MSESAPLVKLTIDGVDVEVPAGANVVDAANRAGIEVPIFCHHPRLEPVGMCRMCLVEVGTPVVDRATGEVQLDEHGDPQIRFFPKMQAGCTMRVSEGMVVRTATDEVADARRSVLEFLLTSHPLDCPVCDKGGECPLQNLTMRYGPGQSRFSWGEKYHFEKPVPVGPLITLDRERCVLCARCIRFEDEIADDQVLGFENRGRGMEIVSVSDPPFASYFSGNTTDICPVGALTTKDFRFESRVWELESKPGICGHCSVGCNLSHDTRGGRVLRVMPRENDAVNEIWLCDKGRFAHHHAAAPERLSTPLVRREGELVSATWAEALGEVARRLDGVRETYGPAAIGGIAGDHPCNEDLYLFGRFLRSVIGTSSVDHAPGILRDDLVRRAGPGADLRLPELGAGTAVVVAGLDVEEEAPVLFLNLFKALRNGARVVSLGSRPQKLDPHVTALRYRSEDAASLAATLVAETLDRHGAVVPEAAELRASLAGFDAAALAGRHPMHVSDLAEAVDALVEAEDLLVLYGREAAELGLAEPLAALLAATGRLGREGSGLIAVGPHGNSQGAADMGLLPDWLPGYAPVGDSEAGEALVSAGWPSPPPTEPGLDGAAMLDGGVRALYLMGCDPVGDDPALAAQLGELDFLVVHEIFLTETAALADVVLPARSLAERDGTLTSFTRRVQRSYAAVDPVGESRPDWQILRDLAQRFGVAEAFGHVGDVTDEIARALPSHAEITWQALGPQAATAPTDVFLPFAPMTEARHVSYEGTSYDNPVGEGAAWEPTPDAASLLAWRPADAAAGDGEVEGTLRLLVGRRLYDGGRLARASCILAPLVIAPTVWLGPFDINGLGLTEGQRVRLERADASERAIEGVVGLREGLTPGTVLVEESLAWAIEPRALASGATALVRLIPVTDECTVAEGHSAHPDAAMAAPAEEG